jgi:hypothetical protein
MQHASRKALTGAPIIKTQALEAPSLPRKIWKFKCYYMRFPGIWEYDFTSFLTAKNVWFCAMNECLLGVSSNRGTTLKAALFYKNGTFAPPAPPGSVHAANPTPSNGKYCNSTVLTKSKLWSSALPTRSKCEISAILEWTTHAPGTRATNAQGSALHALHPT